MKIDIIYLDKVDSTNTYAKKLLNELKAGEGTVVWAREQYAGCGLGENTWHSRAGMNLTFSLILEPLFIQPDNLFCLNKAVALAVFNTIRTELSGDIQASIKWPNDIYAGDRKIAGILIEHTILGTSIKHSVIGVGINLNQVDFPADLPNPASLKQITGLNHDSEKFLENVCRSIDKEYSRLNRGEFKSINDDYNSSLFGCGCDLEFIAGSCSFTGRIKGVDDLGRLLVMTQDEKIGIFNHGEIILK